jgi:HSP20 family molecular chaperone IbpA
MWAQACELVERAERLHRQFFDPAPAAGRAAWQPPVDLFETEGEVWIFVALPGVPANRLEVGLQGGTLQVAGERPLPPALRRAAVHRLEIPQGRFERRLELPVGRYELASHELVDGCLVLNLRKLF